MHLTPQETAAFESCQSALEQQLFCLPPAEKVARFSWGKQQAKSSAAAGEVGKTSTAAGQAEAAGVEVEPQQSHGRGYFTLPAKEVFEVSSSISSSSSSTSDQLQLPFERELCKALLKFDILGRKLLGSLSSGTSGTLLSLLEGDGEEGTSAAAAPSLLHASCYHGPEDSLKGVAQPGREGRVSGETGEVGIETEPFCPGEPPSSAPAAAAGASAAAPPAEAAAAPAAAGGLAQCDGNEAHHDRGLLTLITSSCAEGLEVQDPGTGCWEELLLGPGQMAVMVGATLTAASAGDMPTCRHRVVS